MINIPKLPPFKRFCITIGAIPATYIESLSYYETLLWLCKYLQDTVIPAINTNAEAVTELQTAFETLQSYVDNYFENLDVQEEINNKLDDMAESGELEDIIAQYLNSNALLTFDSVSDLKNADNLIDGSNVQTLGYHSKGDSGQAKYYVREVTNQDVVDDVTIIALNNFNNLVAVLIIENSTIPVEVFGAYGDNTHDDTQAIQNCIDYCTTNNYTCFFNNKIYLTSQPLEIKELSVLSGGVSNDEYNNQARIKNITSDMITITSDIVGAKIKNLCFISDNTKQLYFLHNETDILKWCEIIQCGFREFYKVFDASTLGCKMKDLYINYGVTFGKLRGSDNTIEDCFISSPHATTSDDLMVLDGYSLSRLTNVYFTGKVDSETGCNNILKIDGYSSNLSFNGCFFDYSNGPGVTILGKGDNFPDSGATNISFNNCLFRGNCCNQDTVTHIINADYCRNVNIINCSFDNTEHYTINSDSKIYNLGQYSQGVFLLNNYYRIPYSTNTNYINNASIIEPYSIEKFGNVGIKDNNHTLSLISSFRNRKIFYRRINLTSGATYGEVNIAFDENMGEHPIVFLSVEQTGYVVTINSVTSTQVQGILRRVSDGGAVTNTNLNFSVLVINND